MKKRTESRQSTPTPLNSEILRRAVGWAMDAKIFANWKPHGNTRWLPPDLILLAVVWACRPTRL